MPQHVDVLIIGQGLAGSLLATALIARGQRVQVIDNSHRGSASVVAAGLINPLAGMRFNPPPGIDAWLATADRIYGAWERELGETLWHPLPMMRLFRSAAQQRFHDRLLGSPAAALLGSRFDDGADGEPVRAPFGGFHQLRTGYVSIGRLLDGIRQTLIARGAYRATVFESGQLGIGENAVSWKDCTASLVVFCEGYRVKDNPWFDWLPLQPDRGEVLTLDRCNRLPRRIINGAYWLIPQADGRYRFGATHDHACLDLTPSDAGRETLLSGLAGLLTTPPPPIVAQQVGVRPATRDRKPLLGRHPQQPRLAVFNGFGARGALAIPWYAERFADFVLDRAPLPAEADIRRAC